MAITRKEALLKSISGGESANVSPITREEQYLSYIAGESNSYPSQPITREEVYLDKIAKSGVSGGSGVNVQSLSVTENGTYTAPSGVAYSPVFVNVASSGGGGESGEKSKLAQLVDKSITEITEADLQGATIIGGNMFAACNNLTYLPIPDSVTQVISDATFNSQNLKRVTVGSGIRYIGYRAFGSLPLLEVFRIYAEKPPTLDSNTFLGSSSTFRIEVLADSLEAYKAATNWSKYADRIFAIEE